VSATQRADASEVALVQGEDVVCAHVAGMDYQRSIDKSEVEVGVGRHYLRGSFQRFFGECENLVFGPGQSDRDLGSETVSELSRCEVVDLGQHTGRNEPGVGISKRHRRLGVMWLIS